MNIEVIDYHEGGVDDLRDPTAPTEEVDRNFMDQLAKLITKFEEVLDVGNGDLRLADIAEYIAARGDALDLLEDPILAEWLNHMRQTARCPYRKFAVRG